MLAIWEAQILTGESCRCLHTFWVHAHVCILYLCADKAISQDRKIKHRFGSLKGFCVCVCIRAAITQTRHCFLFVCLAACNLLSGLSSFFPVEKMQQTVDLAGNMTVWMIWINSFVYILCTLLSGIGLVAVIWFVLICFYHQAKEFPFIFQHRSGLGGPFPFMSPCISLFIFPSGLQLSCNLPEKKEEKKRIPRPATSTPSAKESFHHHPIIHQESNDPPGTQLAHPPPQNMSCLWKIDFSEIFFLSFSATLVCDLWG